MKKYIDFQNAGTTKGEQEIGTLVYENGKIEPMSTKYSIACYGNSYSSKDYLELNVAEIKEDCPNIIFYKIEREGNFENPNISFNISIPNHLIGQTQNILNCFDENTNGISYSEKAVIKNFNIEEVLVSSLELDNKIQDFCGMNVEDLINTTA